MPCTVICEEASCAQSVFRDRDFSLFFSLIRISDVGTLRPGRRIMPFHPTPRVVTRQSCHGIIYNVWHASMHACMLQVLNAARHCLHVPSRAFTCLSWPRRPFARTEAGSTGGSGTRPSTRCSARSPRAATSTDIRAGAAATARRSTACSSRCRWRGRRR